MGETFNLMDSYVSMAATQLGASMDWDIMDMMKGYPPEFKYAKGKAYHADRRYKNWKDAQKWMDNHLQERAKFIRKSTTLLEGSTDE